MVKDKKEEIKNLKEIEESTKDIEQTKNTLNQLAMKTNYFEEPLEGQLKKSSSTYKTFVNYEKDFHYQRIRKD